MSLNLLLMVIVGGSGYFLGPFVGAMIAVLLPEWLRFTEGYYLMAYAAMVMALMAFCPSGILGLLGRAAMALQSPKTNAALRKVVGKPQ
jgi:branched-chain amino acid transport system permease protein